MTLPNSLPIPIEDEHIVFQGLIVEVVQQKMREGDREKTYEFARRSPGIRLLIISPENKILLSREYRSELKSWDYRLPGGKVFDSLLEYKEFLKSGQDMLVPATAAAKKEAEEEAGIRANEIKHYSTSSGGATMRWSLYYFLITKYTLLNDQNLGTGENIELNWVSFEEAKSFCLNGVMSEDRSVAFLLRYILNNK